MLRVPWRTRLRDTVQLWPFMMPLFLVYASEYAMQSGGQFEDQSMVIAPKICVKSLCNSMRRTHPQRN